MATSGTSGTPGNPGTPGSSGTPGTPPGAGADIAAVRSVARLARLLERASGELGLAHYRVLMMVSAGNERASRLASALALGKPAVSASVESRGGRGLLERAGVAGDLRAVRLRLTSAGTRALETAEAQMTSRLDELVARADDPAAVIGALADLEAALDRYAAERRAARATGSATHSASSAP